jgi:hypothetical protein
MAKVTKYFFQNILHIFEKDKIPGLDGFLMEFYTILFDILGDDILKTIEYSSTTGQILAPFNSNLISLIPKIDNPQDFD